MKRFTDQAESMLQELISDGIAYGDQINTIELNLEIMIESYLNGDVSEGERAMSRLRDNVGVNFRVRSGIVWNRFIENLNGLRDALIGFKDEEPQMKQ